MSAAVFALRTTVRGRGASTPFLLGVVGAAVVLLFGVAGNPAATTTYTFSAAGSSIQLGSVSPSVGLVAWLAGGVILVLGAYGWTARRRRYPRSLLALALGASVLAFLTWAAAGHTVNVASLVEATGVSALPLLLGALGGLLCERSGVINIAIEGQFLLGAFVASAAASAAGLWVGLVAGALAGAVIGVLLAVLAVRFAADQVIVGFVLNLLVLGLTGFLFTQVIVPDQLTLGSPPIFAAIAIPGLSKLPIVGTALFDQNVILYLAVALLVGIQLMLRRTRWGLRTIAVGESPEAAQSAGIDVLRLRFVNVVAGGLLAGLGGVYLTIGTVGAFSPNISSGKGFIALAVLILGGWTARGALLAALLFGLAEAIQSTLSVMGSPIPSEILQMFPYVVTVLAVAGLVGRVRPPAADGKPFIP